MAKFFIHRPVFAIVISLLILITGGISIGTLPVAQYPQISPPTVEVEINYPGANCRNRGAVHRHQRRGRSERRREHDLHVVEIVERRALRADVHIQGRRQPRHGERRHQQPRQQGDRQAAEGSGQRRHFGEEEIAGHAAGHLRLLARQYLRRDLPFQLHLHQPGGSHRPYARRRLHHDRRPARLRHALLGAAGQAGKTRAHRRRSRQRHQRAEPGGSRRPGGPAACEDRHAVPVHRQRQGTPDGPRGIRKHDRPHAGRRLHSANEGCSPHRALRQELYELRPQRRHPCDGPDHLSAPRRQCDSDGGECAEPARGNQQDFPAGSRIPRLAGHHRSSSRWRSTRSSTPCAMPSSWC